MTDAPVSLAAFAGDLKRSVQWLAEQEVWPEVIEGYHSGIGGATIRRWLIRERDFTDKQLPSPEAISRYLRNNHAREE
jgi:hypothetical protein